MRNLLIFTEVRIMQAICFSECGSTFDYSPQTQKERHTECAALLYSRFTSSA
ncbi:MAG: hypothetical protein ACKVJG_18120 [Candidatus Latescibacterota bacterium]